jgi:uncharacterized membrane protein required for colicin V production
MQQMYHDLMAAMHLNWFDLVVITWLVIGIFRGRKNGMSQELLPLFQWIAVIIVASLTYMPAARMLVHYTGLTLLPCLLISYVFIGTMVYALLGKLKPMLDKTFQDGDYFGGGEYYMGMTSGVIRFTCIIVALLAMMNARIITKSERDATLRMQEKNFEGVRFPTYGEVQYAMLFESTSGSFIRDYMSNFLIQSINMAPPVPKPTRRPTSVAQFQKQKEESFNITFAHKQ